MLESNSRVDNSDHTSEGQQCRKGLAHSLTAGDKSENFAATQKCSTYFTSFRHLGNKKGFRHHGILDFYYIFYIISAPGKKRRAFDIMAYWTFIIYFTLLWHLGNKKGFRHHGILDFYYIFYIISAPRK